MANSKRQVIEVPISTRVSATLRTRFKPIYDDTFDDLIEKLNKIK